jgi:ubiquinone/menaquinone biosynthesis C-methylase UbiE
MSSQELGRFWDKVSEAWDWIPSLNYKIEKFHKNEEKFILSFIENKDSRILDIGCGTGRILKLLAANGFTNLLGLDISSKMLCRCKERLGDRVNLIQHDFRERLPFKSNLFDFALITGNTLTGGGDVDHANLVLKEVKRVLKNGGKLIIGSYNAKFLKNFVENYYKKFPQEFRFKGFDPRRRRVYIGEVFTHWVSQGELEDLMRNSGFEEVKIKREGVGLIAIARK